MKIQLTDIMIGNWFIGYDGKPFQWSLEHFELLGKGVDIDEILKEPVFLSDDILSRLGFFKDTTGENINHPDYHEWYEEDFPIVGTLCQNDSKEYLFDMDTDTLRIRYLHELQNLYKVITKTDLKIQL